MKTGRIKGIAAQMSAGFFIRITRNKRNTLIYLIATVILLTGVAAVYHNYSWYDRTIVKIVSAKNSLSHTETGPRGNENYYDQALSGVIMNGSLQGSAIHLSNVFSDSGVYDDKYQSGDEVFVQIHGGSGSDPEGTITGFKRDKYAALLAAAFLLLILVIAKRKGFFSILSLMINITVFYFAINLYASGYNILFLSIGLVLLFPFVSLVLITGWEKKTFAAILSTLISISIVMILFEIVMAFTDGVDYAFMEYIASPSNLPEIFMSQILLGGLGAIMDVAITEASTMDELVRKNPDITAAELLKSGRELGHDIMGTMINVMLFTYLAGSIPLIILKMNSEIRLHTIILWHLPMEMYRFLLGSIGILLSIPVSLFVSILLFKKLRRFA